MLERKQSKSAAQLLSFADFTALVARHQRELFGFLRGIVQHAEQASDLLQDTFVDAWRAAQRGQPPLTPDAPREEARRWLFHAAYCRAISALRRRRLIRWESLDDPEAADSEALSSLASFEDRVAESAAMQAALADLSPRDVSCLLLIVVQGFTAAEAAEIIGDSPQAIARRISRAKRRLLAAYLAQDAGDQEPRHR